MEKVNISNLTYIVHLKNIESVESIRELEEQTQVFATQGHIIGKHIALVNNSWKE
jgi:hypothetical protein